MQDNEPNVTLTPSMSHVNVRWCRAVVLHLESLQENNPSLMADFVAWCRTGNEPALSGSDQLYLLKHSLIFQSGHLPDPIRDVVTMSVSGDSVPFTIDPTVFG